MSGARNSGGPAFPVSEEEARGKVAGIYGGMRLRDYFIAHAPEIPAWFRPDVPAGPQMPTFLTDLSESERWELDGWREDAVGIADMKSQRVREYAEAMSKYRKESQSLSDLAERERTLQWPGAWADEQLKRRSA